MPGLFTHTYILFSAFRQFKPSHPILNKIVESNSYAYLYNVTEKKYDYKNKAQCLLAGCAYLGSCGPDLFYLEQGSQGTFIADLLHYNKTGLYLVSWLDYLKPLLAKPPASPKQTKQLAYCLGHASHIASDINIHPYVNSIVGAYPDNAVAFTGAEVTSKMKGAMWKFHNILEHYQDSYVFYRLFVDDAGFKDDWESVNIASAAGDYFFKNQNSAERFLVSQSKKFYKYGANLESTFENEKYEFFRASSWTPTLDVQSYFNHVIPDKNRMINCQRLVQGGTFSKEGKRLSKGLFDLYIDRAVATTLEFWKEIDVFLTSEAKTEKDFEATKKYFPKLRRHWNLDTGLALGVEGHRTSFDLPNAQKAKLHIAGKLSLESIHNDEIADIT
ncbi:MAG: zinc dependent phospholipase C family protein [Pseudomonadota bacterium]